MIRVLITGVHSYIGDAIATYLNRNNVIDKEEISDLGSNNEFYVEKISLRGDTWKSIDFSMYDTIIHVAAIVHGSKKNQSEDYYDVNVTKTLELARLAKEAGVKQFIYFSSMSIYGLEEGVITKETIICPKNAYGITKYKAEKELLELNQNSFKICILRPPMVYGKGCKGNYQRLRKFALLCKILPSFKNARSMIYIGNLNKFIEHIIKNQDYGIFFPQNKEYVNTCDMMKEIARCHGKKRFHTSIFNPMIQLCLKKNKTCKKIFGSLIYDSSLSKIEIEELISFKESLEETEQ